MNKKQYAECFHIKNRVSGFRYTTVDAIPELKDFIMNLHLEHFYKAMPNDWIYEIVSDAFFELACDDLDKITIEADAYYSELYKWLNEGFADKYCQEYMDEFGPCDKFWDIISGGQWLAKTRIYDLVNGFLEEHATEESEE